eukprot:CAMPEP_0172518918 /NCGR_PEP_ID=MMETSP1066-20121228/291102_1 /TAXON_ID=671091 /ORGANISM="Coscinodiscus wailesii, Strain CCMP2513" /LENGTH=106 /DNA_ID=CAMNT_0013301401 /DNA_START=778 /DNA_END=1098 /DNA_ORIENTATION=-
MEKLLEELELIRSKQLQTAATDEIGYDTPQTKTICMTMDTDVSTSIEKLKQYLDNVKCDMEGVPENTQIDQGNDDLHAMEQRRKDLNTAKLDLNLELKDENHQSGK